MTNNLINLIRLQLYLGSLSFLRLASESVSFSLEAVDDDDALKAEEMFSL